MKLDIQSLQFRRMNKTGRMTLRMAWDVLSREDATVRCLIETWGGKPDGYIKCFPTDLVLGDYLSKRIAKSASGVVKDEDIDLTMVGAEMYIISGECNNLNKAMDAQNHENAKMRMNIKGIKTTWDEEACLNKTLSGLVEFGDVDVSADTLTQAMAGRVRDTFRNMGGYNEQLISIHEFMQSTAEGLDDVLGDGEAVSYAPMDRERIVEIIQLAEGLREKLIASKPTLTTSTSKSTTAEYIPEPEINRGEAWGGWA